MRGSTWKHILWRVRNEACPKQMLHTLHTQPVFIRNGNVSIRKATLKLNSIKLNPINNNNNNKCYQIKLRRNAKWIANSRFEKESYRNCSCFFCFQCFDHKYVYTKWSWVYKEKKTQETLTLATTFTAHVLMWDYCGCIVGVLVRALLLHLHHLHSFV